jgi:hypothetical protein
VRHAASFASCALAVCLVPAGDVVSAVTEWTGLDGRLPDPTRHLQVANLDLRGAMTKHRFYIVLVCDYAVLLISAALSICVNLES